MKISTIAFFVFACLAVIGNLVYGSLLLETMISGTNTVVSIVYADLFILWLFPIAVLFVLLIEEKFSTRKKSRSTIEERLYRSWER